MRPEIENTPIPEWMKKLPRDKRGYPIPYIALIDKEGTAHFTVNEEQRRQEVIKEELCGICGRKLLRWRALVGGPQSAFLEDGAYLDPAMHVECVTYALKVCPFLAMRSFNKRIEGKTINPSKLEPGIHVAVDEKMVEKRPLLFVMVVHMKCDPIYFGYGPTVQYVKPRKPYVRVEYWQHGQQLDNDVGEARVKEILTEVLVREYAEASPRAEEAAVSAILQSR